MKSFNQFLLENTSDMTKSEIFDLVERLVDYIEFIDYRTTYDSLYKTYPEDQWDKDLKTALELSKSSSPHLTDQEKKRLKDTIENDYFHPYQDMDEEMESELSKRQNWIGNIWRRLANDPEVAEYIIKTQPSRFDWINSKFPELGKKYSQSKFINKFNLFDKE